ncbi:SLC13 family permease [Colwellia sp. 1_MG-2023]|uniref:SLC13 family permease n=1 Tax=unclassified Colwellia TaxID=196834 RepID=UPI001C09C331|nr:MULTISPECIES: SLC13 family permease [unclassified Colwellia]MBU2925760.1 SLC13 family permease [Colwellia sp. C2M11]MDO6651014.1 SLC13 family permease [Colwellia sp. 3_MG-2023]MDO6664049.1 SLC13 family permease [Colwellia sp. 2_MG-2023]MDO6688400.1 SLC13 family permease [Colwellia sp. 1_MG-2023]
MTIQQWLIIAVFIATFVGLLKYQQAPERVFSITVLVCLALSFVSVDDILSNAVNPGLVTLILLVLCSFSFERTSILRRLSNSVFSGSKIKSMLRLVIGTAFASALMSNTAVVATLINSVKSNKLINAGKLLLPLSYAAILGGTLTLVGTSTNLIVNSLLIEQGGQGLAFFDFTGIGIVALAFCLLIVVLRAKTLPNMAQGELSTQDYLLEAEVSIDSKLIGKSIEENGLRNLDALFLVEIVRYGRLISPVTPEETLQVGDKLIFSGDISKVLTLQQFDGLTLFAERNDLLRDNLTEVLIKSESAIAGKTLKKAGFRARFDAAVVAVRREGCALSGKLGDIVLQSGDFLVLAVGQDFASRTNLSKNFFILSGHQAVNMLSGWRDHGTIWGFVLAILVSVLTPVSLLSCLFIYVAALIFSGALTVNEIKRRFPLEIWMIVLGALTLASAVENTGAAAVIASSIEQLLNGSSPYIAFVAIFVLTLLLTELITNSAAAALIFPIAYNIALGLGVDPIPFVMAVAFAASGSFISPYGYQTNIMVYNAGNYQLGDFVKFGLPVSITYSATVLLMIPLVFPF